MIRFPRVPASAGVPLGRMPLRDYARFSERCLKSNSAITPKNCLLKRVSEETMPKAFSLTPPR